MNGYVVVGLNHKTASVELREEFAVTHVADPLGELRELAGEAVILGTCNRFEVYSYAVPEPERIVDWVAARAGRPSEDVRRHGYVRVGRNACKHLFFVASSLDSLVVGETQIRRQVREAYEAATEAGGVGPMLHRLFQTALSVSKEIRERTGIGRGSVSVAGAAADLAERIFSDLVGAQVLVIGAGETAELVMNHLFSRGVKRFHVLNRTPERAEELAARFEAEGGGLETLGEHLPQADILVAAAGGEESLVGVATMRAALKRRRGRPIVALDVAVPRGVDPGIDSLDNVYRYDMDSLTEVTKDALRYRRREFLQCCTMVDAATLRLAEKARSRQLGAAIAELEEGYKAIAEGELEALEHRLPQLPEGERQHVRRAVHRIVRKLLHMPVRALRDGSPEESEVIRRAFAAREKRTGE
ncbi:MAG: glutamyl-tRNA reductase [Planctomycetota bacterium]|jgi:glutamyl-tRNA reductase